MLNGGGVYTCVVRRVGWLVICRVPGIVSSFQQAWVGWQCLQPSFHPRRPLLASLHCLRGVIVLGGWRLAERAWKPCLWPSDASTPRAGCANARVHSFSWTFIQPWNEWGKKGATLPLAENNGDWTRDDVACSSNGPSIEKAQNALLLMDAVKAMESDDSNLLDATTRRLL